MEVTQIKTNTITQVSQGIKRLSIKMEHFWPTDQEINKLSFIISIEAKTLRIESAEEKTQFNRVCKQ